MTDNNKRKWTPARSEDFERWIDFEPAYDGRDPDPKKNYGVGSVIIRFIIRGPLGATQFVLYTGWYLPTVAKELSEKDAEDIQMRSGLKFSTPAQLIEMRMNPMPADLGYHSYKPHYDGHERMGSCGILPDAPGGCFYDGSGLAADAIYAKLVSQGSDSVWEALEEHYRDIFESACEGE